MTVHPFFLSIDGSNDTGLQKMNPITVKIYDYKENKISTQFLNMCTCTSSTADALCNVLDGKLNPWNMYTAVGVDNTSINIGIRDCIKTRVFLHNLAIYFCGCPCHIIHNTARKIVMHFIHVVFLIKRKCALIHTTGLINLQEENGLESYCTFCDQKYCSIIKHVTTRWLSLE